MKLRVKIENDIYDVAVGDLSSRPILVTVDGETFEVYPESFQETGTSQAQLSPHQTSVPAPELIPPVNSSDCAQQASSSSSESRTVTAPIPGVIISIAVKPGDQVEHGQELCVLEAMKMKNAIRANRAGKIDTIHISKGDSVNHGQTLMDFSG